MLTHEGVSERGCGKERLVSSGSALSSVLLLPVSGISLVFGISLSLVSLWFWILPSSGLSLVLESHWCLDLAQELCCIGGIDPDVTFAQLAILYTPGLGNSREDQEARRKQGLEG